ncbi:Ribokinase-like protein [Rhizopogon vinicolor AM-OR11-026]|uniref:ATP-dependent (S)-NAD(P)H-hydrate dehydratase n=1 Tax=Rhizopogon vinicolor AM-OR11-026 TaxID=1314800 RepID=A0A1B7N434_9AGAM|nr:Ribokinase-like protein [Rhizopogon vinicolor AM-OR11-026]
MPVPRTVIEQIKQIIPPLNGSLHKGQSGRVGVLGGAFDYTGAPFFAAISALRLGADLSHVICAPTAAQAIKSYSPDLIVHPILSEEAAPGTVEETLRSLLSRLHVLVMGPGLGREAYMQSYARMALSIARERAMFVVLDADALWMVQEDLRLIEGYRRAVLTPNVVEFKRLSESAGISPDVPAKERAAELSRRLGGVVVLEKGATDLIASDTTGEAASLEVSGVDGEDGERQRLREVVEVDVEGGLKRCGGQGDVLSGTVGAMLAWGKCYEDGAFGDGSIPVSRLPLLAAVGGSMVTRTSSRRAFQLEGRGLVTQDMLPQLGKSFSEVFGEDLWAGEKGRL